MTTVGVAEINGIVRHFEEMDDPRSQVNRLHLLEDVIVISILESSPERMDRWPLQGGRRRRSEWLKRHLRLPNGVPSRDTIGRVLQSLKPSAFQQCFAAWLTSLHEETADRGKGQHEKPLRQIALDGKCLRRSHAHGRGLGAMYLVSAWATDQGIALGQLAVEEKSNEITAIPQLLDQLDLTDAVVTIDAAGCQRNIADEIVAGGGDYVLALKGNQETLHRDVTESLRQIVGGRFCGDAVSRYEEREPWSWTHGRAVLLSDHRAGRFSATREVDRLEDRSAWRFDGEHRTAKRRLNTATTSAVYRVTVVVLQVACEIIGASRTICIGCWT